MRRPWGANGVDLLVEDIAATPSVPSAVPATNALRVRDGDNQVPDSVTINVEFHDGAGNVMPGVIYFWDSDLSKFIPSRVMLFADATDVLADTTNQNMAGKFQVYLDTSVEWIFFQPDFDNLAGSVGNATKIHYTLTLDEALAMP